ncbi:MAG: hypothetical protein GEU87_21795, partial [Alphaproteobacteria bacterium]|nr:hypothetical protein [Alphaproteobacteria bacterium]
MNERRDTHPEHNGATRPVPLLADIAAEQTVLGTALMRSSTIGGLRDTVTAASFHRPAHADLWDFLATTYNAGNPVTAETAWARLSSTTGHPTIPGVDAGYLIQLLEHATAAAGIHAGRIRDLARLRVVHER